jgi:uncharacterized protein (DUF488 family)
LRKTLFTIGYSGCSIHDFIRALKSSGVGCVIDSRELPISRKRGFAKSALRQHLAEAEIAYYHFRKLGSPRSARHDLRETGDYVRFFAQVRRHLSRAEPLAELRTANDIARRIASCVMCCCADWQLCHRKCVVEALTRLTAFDVQHIGRLESDSLVRKAG